MAKYLKESDILCEAYVRVDKSFEEFEKKIKNAEAEIEKTFNEFVQKRSKHFLYSDVDSNCSFEDGSVIVRITIYGSLLAMLSATSGARFSDKVKDAHHNAKNLSASLIAEELIIADSKYSDLLRSEARVGVIGKLNQIVRRIDKVVKHEPNESSHQMAIEELKEVYKNVKRLNTSLINKDEVSQLSKEILGELAYVPSDLVRSKNKTPSSINSKEYKKELKKFKGLLTKESGKNGKNKKLD